MPDMKSLGLIYAKGILFLLAGLLAATMLLVQNPTVTTALLLVVAVWSFARFYYFAFYVIERYVDPGYRFVGLWSFARYVLAARAPSAEGIHQRTNSRDDRGYPAGRLKPTARNCSHP